MKFREKEGTRRSLSFEAKSRVRRFAPRNCPGTWGSMLIGSRLKV